MHTHITLFTDCPPNRCEERYGPTWQVIVGEDFKVAFTHDTKHYMLVEAGKQSVLVWR